MTSAPEDEVPEWLEGFFDDTAADAASEGIDLHEHCHRLVNYDIPFNPDKLEPRRRLRHLDRRRDGCAADGRRPCPAP